MKKLPKYKIIGLHVHFEPRCLHKLKDVCVISKTPLTLSVNSLKRAVGEDLVVLIFQITSICTIACAPDKCIV